MQLLLTSDGAAKRATDCDKWLRPRVTVGVGPARASVTMTTLNVTASNGDVTIGGDHEAIAHEGDALLQKAAKAAVERAKLNA
jgi:hypothetical protein